MTHRKLLAATAAAVLALSACTGGSEDTTAGPATSPSTTAGETSAGQTNAPAPSEDSEHSAADVMFARMMIPHHQQAVEMSDLLLAKDGIPVDVEKTAVEIKATQGPEMQQLRQWLEMWGPTTGSRKDDDGEVHGSENHGSHGGPDMGEGMGEDMSDDAGDVTGEGMGGGAEGSSSSGEMPMMEGMLSEQEMQELSDAQGTDAARLFLKQMIAHHEGAIDMAEDEVSDGIYPPAVEMARTIIDTQQREIDQMSAMLAAL